MKKIGLWMAALTAVTVGGVYATFNYSDTNDMKSADSRTSITIAGSSVDGAAGAFSIEARNLLITIDSAKTVLGDEFDPATTNAHKAMLDVSGSIVVKFTPTAGLQETDILNNGLHAKVSFTSSWGSIADWTYTWDNQNIQIFSALNANEIEIHQVDETSQENRWTREDDGTFTYTITAEQLFGASNFNPLLVMNDIVLETYEEYEAFHATFSGKGILAKVEAASHLDD